MKAGTHMRADMNAGPKELDEDFIRSLPDSGPVVMVNLLRFKGESADGDGSGWDAYSRYSKAIPPLLTGVGGTILWVGDCMSSEHFGPWSGDFREYLAHRV
jgi:hypothetical protein